MHELFIAARVPQGAASGPFLSRARSKCSAGISRWNSLGHHVLVGKVQTSSVIGNMNVNCEAPPTIHNVTK
jgi:hypothetical protein